jgi:hypothetical protein
VFSRSVTPDDMVAGYFHTMIVTINHHFSGTQQQMATTIADSIRDALNQKITPLRDNITALGNHLDATTANATVFASIICRKIANTVTPLCADISMLHDCLDALNDRTRNNVTIANASTHAFIFCTKMATMVNPLCDNLTAMEARLAKRPDDSGSHMNHITKNSDP